MKTNAALWLGMAGLVHFGTVPVRAATYWADPAGKSGNAGTAAAPFDLVTGVKMLVAGDSLFLKAGTYSMPYAAGAKNSLVCAVKATQAAPIVVRCPTGRAVLDFGFPEDTYLQDSYGISLTGDWWTFERIDVTRAGYQGTYVTGDHNTYDNCRFYRNRNSGVEVNKGGSNTLLHNVDAYDNYDPKKGGSMSDGFAIKQTMGSGNRLVGCRAWNNSDDGYDTFDSPEFVTLDSCWAFRNGWYHGDPNDSRNTTSMNGNGFKVGGLAQVQRNVLRHCVAFLNKARGFDQNSNTGGNTVVNSTSWKNGTQNYSFGATLASGEKNVFINNISLAPGSADVITSATSTTNTWNSIAVATSDFQSLDTSIAIPARDDDGSIPQNAFLRLKTGSKLIDAGTKGSLAFQGKAPDLGAFEAGAGTTGIATAKAKRQGAVLRGGFLELSLDLPEASTLRLRVVDVSGQILSNSAVSLPAGGQVFRIPAGSVRAGFVQVERDGRPWMALGIVGR